MADIKTAQTQLDDDEVKSYLKAHPDFLLRHIDLIDTLLPPDSKNGDGVADFQQFMVKRLQAETTKAKAVQKEIIENARANMNNHLRIQEAVLRLLEAKTFSEFIQTITTDLAVILDVDVVSLVIESDGVTTQQVQKSGIKVAPINFVDLWLQGHNATLRANPNPSEDIFGPAAALVQSEALLRLDASDLAPPGILAFGSRDPDMFHSDQAIDQVNFLTHVVERLICAWLDLPG